MTRSDIARDLLNFRYAEQRLRNSIRVWRVAPVDKPEQLRYSFQRQKAYRLSMVGREH